MAKVMIEQYAEMDRRGREQALGVPPADPSRATAQTVTTSATHVTLDGKPAYVAITNTDSSDAVYISFSTGDDDSLTISNGYPVLAGATRGWATDNKFDRVNFIKA